MGAGSGTPLHLIRRPPFGQNRKPMRYAIVTLMAVVFCSSMPRAAEWPQFRGPGGKGVADDSSLPQRWTSTENVAWVAEVPGRGWSSPIVWRDRVFVTSAVNSGEFKQPSPGIYGNDYAAELEKQGLSEAEIVKRVVGRDIELTG